MAIELQKECEQREEAAKGVSGFRQSHISIITAISTNN